MLGEGRTLQPPVAPEVPILSEHVRAHGSRPQLLVKLRFPLLPRLFALSLLRCASPSRTNLARFGITRGLCIFNLQRAILV